jgi:prolyl 4-hydroxylase
MNAPIASPPAPAAHTDLATLRIRAADGGPDDWMRLAQALRADVVNDEVFDLNRRAAEVGHVAGQIEHARMLMYGVACDPNPIAAAHWFGRAEAAGQPVAGYFLALLALGSVALPRDGRINQRVLAAVQANFPPAIRAAAIHFGRRSHPRDQDTCLRLLSHGTNLGDAVAAQLLTERLARGEGCQAQPEAAAGLRAQLAAAGVATLPVVSAAIPPVVYPLRESGLVPPGTLALEDALQAAPMQMLSQTPHVMQIDNLLSADECRLLIACAMPNLRRSQAIDPLMGQPSPMELRTSSDASFDPIVEDLAMRLVQLRIARSARMELTHAEHLIVLRYLPGEEYRPHRDYRPTSSLQNDQPQAGNRARTICVYLNDVEAGGETEFPIGGIRVKPQAGRAVVFDNLHPDGRPDENSLHAGLPVKRGEKWLATLWLRERRYRHY